MVRRRGLSADAVPGPTPSPEEATTPAAPRPALCLGADDGRAAALNRRSVASAPASAPWDGGPLWTCTAGRFAECGERGERGDAPDAQQMGAAEFDTSRAPATCAAVARAAAAVHVTKFAYI